MSDRMTLLLETTDQVLLSFVQSILGGAGIGVQVIGQYTSAIEGSLPIFPRRVLVGAQDWQRARLVLVEAGLGHEIEAEQGQGRS